MKFKTNVSVEMSEEEIEPIMEMIGKMSMLDIQSFGINDEKYHIMYKAYCEWKDFSRTDTDN